MATYAEGLSLGLMVFALTYVSLIIGELVPKRLALTHPEAIASFIARPMELLATIGRPLVKVLSVSTDAVVRLLGVRKGGGSGITNDEIRLLLRQGTEEGVFAPGEQLMVSNVLNLDERRVAAALTPRSEVVYLDVNDTAEANRAKLKDAPHTVLPLCRSGLDHVVGFVRTTRVLDALLDQLPLDLPALADPPLFVPEGVSLMTLLEEFKRRRLSMALVVDEHGGVAGLISLTDIIASIVGDMPSPFEEPSIVRRGDGSWLIAGDVDIATLDRELDVDPPLLSAEDRGHYHTLGGLAMLALDRVPRTGDVFLRGKYRFEIVDMDGNRVDRVLVNRRASPDAAPTDQPPT